MLGAPAAGSGTPGRDGTDSSMSRAVVPANGAVANGRLGPPGVVTTASPLQTDVVEAVAERIHHRRVIRNCDVSRRPQLLV